MHRECFEYIDAMSDVLFFNFTESGRRMRSHNERYLAAFPVLFVGTYPQGI